MSREKGATTTDKAAHRVFDAFLENRLNGTNNGYRCRLCGTSLETAYHEERLYSVFCPVCDTVTLIKAGSPGRAEQRLGHSDADYWAGKV